MSLERPFSPMRAPHNDEGREWSDDDFPEGVKIVALEDIAKTVEKTQEKLRIDRKLNMDVVAHHMGLRTIDVLESFRRHSGERNFQETFGLIAAGERRFDTYLKWRDAILELRKEKRGYTIADIAEKMEMTESSAHSYLRELGKHAEKMLGFRYPRP